MSLRTSLNFNFSKAGVLMIAAAFILTAGITLSFAAINAKFGGNWKTSYGTMTLRVTDEGVTGQYNNNGTIGDIRGAFEGNTLKGRWEDESGTGPINFVFSPDGRSFKGTWGRRKGEGNAGGEWNGWR